MSKQKKMNSVVTERGQVTIPKSIRDKAGIMAGTVLVFEYRDGKVTVSKDANRNPVASVYGCLKGATPYKTTDAYIDEIRGVAK
jgi:AbrB family looped-hinge helix DNA binding protein